MNTKSKIINCTKCGHKLKSVKTDIMLRTQMQPIDEPYDGMYKPLVFTFCPICDKQTH